MNSITPRDDLLVWIDLEMTGLEPEKDMILEIATLITDNSLEIVAKGPELIIHQSDVVLGSMNDWCKKQHGKTGLSEAVRASTISLEQAEQQTLEFIQKYCKKQTSPLCGNTIYQDRAFLHKHMPKIDQFLHYRIIDVSSVKELVKRWYPQHPLIEFKKSDTHRALADIQESVSELKQYRDAFFKNV